MNTDLYQSVKNSLNDCAQSIYKFSIQSIGMISESIQTPTILALMPRFPRKIIHMAENSVEMIAQHVEHVVNPTGFCNKIINSVTERINTLINRFGDAYNRLAKWVLKQSLIGIVIGLVVAVALGFSIPPAIILGICLTLLISAWNNLSSYFNN